MEQGQEGVFALGFLGEGGKPSLSAWDYRDPAVFYSAQTCCVLSESPRAFHGPSVPLTVPSLSPDLSCPMGSESFFWESEPTWGSETL